MARWTYPVVGLFVAFLGLAGFFSYQAAKSFLDWKRSYDIQQNYYAEDVELTPETIDKLLAEIGDKSPAGVSEELAYMFVDLRTRRAWYHPDTGVDDLRLALKAANEYYGRDNYIDQYLSRQITFTIATAQLPAKLERWQAEALATDPQSREFTRFMQCWGRLVSDDEAGARELLQSELTDRGDTPNTLGLAFVVSVLLNDDETAADYEANIQRTGIGDKYFDYMYAWYLDEHGRFEDAIKVRQELITIPPTSPDDAIWMALPLAGLYGIDDPQTQAMLDLAPQTTRQSISREAAEASVLAELLRITNDAQYAQRLLQLRAEHPADAQIALAVAGAAIDYRERLQKNRGFDRMAEPEDSADPAAPVRLFTAPLLQYVADSLALADNPNLLQKNYLVKSLALVVPDGTYVPDSTARAESIRCLRLALGDPELPDAVISQRIPDYEFYLLDANIKAARAGDQAYDDGVHRAIIDYLNRRQKLFADIYDLDDIPYRWDRPVAEAATEPDPGAQPESPPD